jgi:hypothetical protein
MYTLSTRWRHRRSYGRKGSSVPPLPAVMDQLVTVSGVQEDVSDAMEDVRSVDLGVDPDLAQSAPNFNNQEEDRRLQNYDDDDGHVPDLYGDYEEEHGEDLDEQLLAGDNIGCNDTGCNEERYIDEIEEMELQRLEAFSSTSSCEYLLTAGFKIPLGLEESLGYFDWKFSSATGDRSYEALRKLLAKSGIEVKSQWAMRHQLQTTFDLPIKTYNCCINNCAVFLGKNQLR